MVLINTIKQMPRFQVYTWLVFLLGFGGVCSSIFAQYVLGMNPCVMCIQQRMALLGIALLALLALLIPKNKLGRSLSVLLMGAPAAFGLYVATKQIYLQSLPPEMQPSCGAPWTFRLRNAPMLDLYEWFIRGTGACGEVYKVLGIALPVWSALFFSFVLLLLIFAWWQTNIK